MSDADFVKNLEKKFMESFTSDVAENFAEFTSSYYKKCKEKGMPEELIEKMLTIIIMGVMPNSGKRKEG